MNKKTFPLRTVLTVTTGRLFTKGRRPHDNGISDLYEILGHMTNDSPMTHQLGQFGKECKSWLLRWFPELDSPELMAALEDLPERMKATVGTHAKDVLADATFSDCVAKGLCREEYEIDQIPHDDHDSKDPIDELVAMRGDDYGIIVVNL